MITEEEFVAAATKYGFKLKSKCDIAEKCYIDITNNEYASFGHLVATYNLDGTITHWMMNQSNTIDIFYDEKGDEFDTCSNRMNICKDAAEFERLLGQFYDVWKQKKKRIRLLKIKEL